MTVLLEETRVTQQRLWRLCLRTCVFVLLLMLCVLSSAAAAAASLRVSVVCGCWLQVSFFERVNNAHFNSLAMIDADGSVLGVYRKSHIPDGPG